MRKTDRQFQKKVQLLRLRAKLEMIQNEADPNLQNLLNDWMDKWLKSGKDVAPFEGKDTERLIKEHEDICMALKRFAEQGPPCQIWHNGTRTYVDYIPGKHESMKTTTARLFFQIITDRFCSTVQRCDYCKRFYSAKTARANKLFCSRECANRGRRPSVMNEEQKKMEKVRKALKDWPPKSLRPGQDIKRWLHEKTGVSMVWLTLRAKSEKIHLPGT